MKIGIDASRANQPEKTGTEWYSYNVIEELKKIDHQNRYFLYTEKPLIGNLGNLPSNFKSKVLKWPPKRFWHQLRLSIEVINHPPDALFVPAHTIPLKCPQNTFTSIHDIGFEKFPELYTPLELKYHQYSLRTALKRALKIFTVSNFTKEEILERFEINPDKIKVIYAAYRNDIFYPIDDQDKIDEVLNKYKIEKPFLLYVGRLEQKKNTPGLVKSFGILKQRRNDLEQLKLVLVGEPGYRYDEVEKNINHYKLLSQVIRPGYVEAEDLPYLLAGSEIFVFPSFYEGFGIPILEAMAVGTPVISSNVASMPEIAGDAAQLIKPKNPEEIAMAIESVIDNSNLRREMINRGLKQVKKFSWTSCARSILNEIQSNN